MKNGILQHLNPWEKLALFIAISFLSSLLFSLLSISITEPLFGVDASNPSELMDLSQVGSIRAMKMLNFFFHIGTFILPSIMFAKLATYDPNDYLLHSGKPKFKLIGITLLLFLSIAILNDLLASINANMDFSFLSKEIQESIDYSQAIRDKSIYAYIGPTWKSFGINIILIAIIPAIGEELVFRGVIQNLIAKASKRIHLSIWITAFIFAFIHFQFMDFLPRFFLGAVFGYVVVFTGSIWTSIWMHFLNNALALFILFGIRRGFINETSWWINFGVIHITFALVLGIIAFYFLSKKSKFNEVKGIYMR